MRAVLRRVVQLGLAACLSLAVSASAADDGCAAARKLTQEFYDWYVTILTDRDATAWQITHRQRGASFSPQLAQALDEDEAAAAKSPDEIVGLDFDPFLASQDPEDHYRAGKATREDGRCRVEVFGLREGKRVRAKPDVVPELERSGPTWRFVNFHYPGHEDLLGVLRLLAEDRKRSR